MGEGPTRAERGGKRTETRTLVVGRAGTGKTRRIMERIRPTLRPSARLDGRRRGLLVLPTYGQVEHVKRLFLRDDAGPRARRSGAGGLGGYFDDSIRTFSGLAEIATGRRVGGLLGSVEKDLLIARALARVSGDRFGGLERRVGFRATALHVIKEIKENGCDPAEVAAALRGCGEERHLALADVVEAYQALLVEKDLLDHEDLLGRLRDRLRDDAALFADIDVLAIDGFVNFTQVEREAVALLAERAGETWVSLPHDPDERRPELFSEGEETRTWLLKLGFREEVLAANRRTKTPGLVQLERALFDPHAEQAENDGSVRILGGADLDDECDRLARVARRLIHHDGYAPAEILIVVRRWDGYREALAAAFARHRVPLRLHTGRRLGGEPIARTAAAWLRALVGGWEAADVRAVVRSGRLDRVRPGDIDALELELRRLGAPSGRVAWLAIERPEPIARALAAMAEAEDALRAATGVRALAARLFDEIERVFPFLEPRPGEDPEIELEAARRDASARRSFAEAIDAVVRGLEAVDEAGASFERFGLVLLDALGRADVRERGRRLQTVHAVGVEEARQWETRAVMVPGLLEGSFPGRPREDLFLRDRERAALNREGALRLKERLRVGDEERFFFYVAVTRARERLFLSYPASERDGRPNLRSFFLTDVERTFTEASAAAHRSVRNLSMVLPDRAEVVDRADVRRRALVGLVEPWRPGEPSGVEVAEAAALHDALVARDSSYRSLVKVAARFIEPPVAVIADDDLRARLTDRRRIESASSLGSFAQCPYQYFARYALRLKTPDEAGVDRMKLGSVAHAALQAVFEHGTEPGAAFDEARRALAGRIGIGDERDLRNLRASVIRFVEQERVRLAAGRLRPAAFEAAFDDGGLVLGGVAVRGVIDRVDLDPEGRARVVDYKLRLRGRLESNGKLRQALEEGEEFQLPIYARAVEAMFDATLAAVEFRGIEERRTIGFVTEEALASGALSRPEKADVEPVPAEELAALIADGEERIAAIDERIRSGDVRIEPTDTAGCGWCDFYDLCRVQTWAVEANRGKAT